jgi:hypothetical protein
MDVAVILGSIASPAAAKLLLLSEDPPEPDIQDSWGHHLGRLSPSVTATWQGLCFTGGEE